MPGLGGPHDGHPSFAQGQQRERPAGQEALPGGIGVALLRVQGGDQCALTEIASAVSDGGEVAHSGIGSVPRPPPGAPARAPGRVRGRPRPRRDPSLRGWRDGTSAPTRVPRARLRGRSPARDSRRCSRAPAGRPRPRRSGSRPVPGSPIPASRSRGSPERERCAATTPRRSRMRCEAGVSALTRRGVLRLLRCGPAGLHERDPHPPPSRGPHPGLAPAMPPPTIATSWFIPAGRARAGSGGRASPSRRTRSRVSPGPAGRAPRERHRAAPPGARTPAGRGAANRSVARQIRSRSRRRRASKRSMHSGPPRIRARAQRVGQDLRQIRRVTQAEVQAPARPPDEGVVAALPIRKIRERGALRSPHPTQGKERPSEDLQEAPQTAAEGPMQIREKGALAGAQERGGAIGCEGPHQRATPAPASSNSASGPLPGEAFVGDRSVVAFRAYDRSQRRLGVLAHLRRAGMPEAPQDPPARRPRPPRRRRSTEGGAPAPGSSPSRTPPARCSMRRRAPPGQ